MARTVVGLFESRNDAQGAMSDLQSAGFGGNNVSYITNSSGGLAGMLGNAGIPQEDASIYASGVEQGGGLIVAQALQDADAEQVASILDRYNVVDISQRGQISQQTTTTRESFRSSGATQTRNTNAYEGGDMVVPIVEEEIHVGKREVESGGVRVNVGVEEVPVNEQVTLREETVNIERRQVNQPVDAGAFDQLSKTGTIEVREHDEQAVVSKEARVVEEIVINKEVEQRTETIQDSVRRTDVDIEQVGGQTRSSGVVETGRVSSSDVSTTSGSSMSGTTGSSDEGIIERGASGLGNAVERTTGTDLDNDGDVGRRDTRNNY